MDILLRLKFLQELFVHNRDLFSRFVEENPKTLIA